MGHNVGNDLSDAIIGLIGTRGPLSRASIARQLGVSPASITHLTRSLIEEGVLREAGTDASSGGRPATLLDLNDRRRYALGVKITPNHLAVTEVEMNKEQGPSTSLDLDMRSPDALDQITQAVAQAARSHQDELMGVGLAIPGFSKPQDPDTVTISGEGVDVWPLWEAGFSHGFRSRLPIHRRDIPVTVQPWSEDTWAYGAASLVFASPIVGRRAS